MREHRFGNSRTGYFVASVSNFMRLKCTFQITMKKILYQILGPILGCVLNSSATYTRINMVYSMAMYEMAMYEIIQSPKFDNR